VYWWNMSDGVESLLILYRLNSLSRVKRKGRRAFIWPYCDGLSG